MAVCDGRSIDVSKLIETDMIRGDYTGTMIYPQYNLNGTYQWYYMSEQDVEDVLLFKGFDTKKDSVKCTWQTGPGIWDFRFLPSRCYTYSTSPDWKSLRDTLS